MSSNFLTTGGGALCTENTGVSSERRLTYQNTWEYLFTFRTLEGNLLRYCLART